MNNKNSSYLNRNGGLNDIYDSFGYSDKGGLDEGYDNTYRWGNPKYGKCFPTGERSTPMTRPYAYLAKANKR
jgi:hypothetical protein